MRTWRDRFITWLVRRARIDIKCPHGQFWPAIYRVGRSGTLSCDKCEFKVRVTWTRGGDGGMPVWASEPSARDLMFAKRDAVLAERPDLVTAADLAPLMGEHEQEYWDWCLERVVGSPDS